MPAAERWTMSCRVMGRSPGSPRPCPAVRAAASTVRTLHLDDRLLADIGLASEETIDIGARRPIGASIASTSGELR
ncbi:hypothetical protein [Mesorhizobium tianshanense]|uniref:hypothetical protein n=1 Tax=Mesorhizobium tianshanense TaxID=39844 RepID=UPI001391F8B0|nr:hypothetical protein [Mesorhizobium tianshanense]